MRSGFEIRLYWPLTCAQNAKVQICPKTLVHDCRFQALQVAVAVVSAQSSIRKLIEWAGFTSRVLTIYKNHPVGNSRHKHKTIKCEVAGVGITLEYIHIS